MERKSGKIQCKYQKNDPTFFGTSNFETWLSRDPITWYPEVRCFGYKMTHFIILPPQKFFSSTLQILGFIAESCHCKLQFIILNTEIRLCTSLYYQASTGRRHPRRPVFSNFWFPSATILRPGNRVCTTQVFAIT